MLFAKIIYAYIKLIGKLNFFMNKVISKLVYGIKIYIQKIANMQIYTIYFKYSYLIEESAYIIGYLIIIK